MIIGLGRLRKGRRRGTNGNGEKRGRGKVGFELVDGWFHGKRWRRRRRERGRRGRRRRRWRRRPEESGSVDVIGKGVGVGMGIVVRWMGGRSEMSIVGREGGVVGLRGVGAVIANQLQSALVVGEIVVDSGSLVRERVGWWRAKWEV